MEKKVEDGGRRKGMIEGVYNDFWVQDQLPALKSSKWSAIDFR